MMIIMDFFTQDLVMVKNYWFKKIKSSVLYYTFDVIIINIDHNVLSKKNRSKY